MGLTKADLFNLTVRDDGPGGVTERESDHLVDTRVAVHGTAADVRL